MRKKLYSLTWKVKNFDCNTQKICDYDALLYREEDIKKLRKKYPDKKEFEDHLHSYLQYYYWARAEYELIIKITPDHYIFLYPWCGCKTPEDVAIDVTNDFSFNWEDFIEYLAPSENEIQYGTKIDIYDQITYKWDEFVKYIFNWLGEE